MMNIVMLIWPGFYKVNATSNPQALVFASAYKKDSRVVIVAIN
jgi:O-glycosyl hydrolase